MTRTLLVLLALLALIATPALCAGGALKHLCPCDDSDQRCGHEADCPDDPCSDLPLVAADVLVRQAEQSWSVLAVAAPMVARQPVPGIQPRCPGRLAQARPGLPFPISDRPLLV